MITIVGTGIQQGDLTARGKKAIREASYVFSRVKMRGANEWASELFASASSFEEMDSLIANHLLEKEKSEENVVFAVVGDGFCDNVGKILEQKTQISVIAGVAENRGRAQSTSFVTMSAYDVNENTYFDTAVPHVFYDIDDKAIASDLKICLLDYYDGETQVTLSDGKNSKVIPLFELDREKKYKLASLFIPAQSDFTKKKRFEFNDLMRVMRRLTAPDGCPWDKVQTHESIRENMLEEAYEAVDAIDNNDIDNMIEEMGDVLLQVVFHCDMATREGEFNFNDVISGVCEKLVSRHTHIFGENKANDEAEALGFWEKAKAKEKHYALLKEQIDRIPDTFPALLASEKFIKKANKYGAGVSMETLKEKVVKALENNELVSALTAVVFLVAISGQSPEIELNKTLKEIERKAVKLEEENALNKLSDNI
ncbi:MAG: MazG family protein [Clostridiales bacterium]|nr:MazG family protein [Clostridiales bacterium]